MFGPIQKETTMGPIKRDPCLQPWGDALLLEAAKKHLEAQEQAPWLPQVWGSKSNSCFHR